MDESEKTDEIEAFGANLGLQQVLKTGWKISIRLCGKWNKKNTVFANNAEKNVPNYFKNLG